MSMESEAKPPVWNSNLLHTGYYLMSQLQMGIISYQMLLGNKSINIDNLLRMVPAIQEANTQC